jgi:hypothetical protein
VLFVSLTAAVALLGADVHRASASPAATLKPTNHCWLDVINDWLDNNRVDKLYAIPCYTQAIQHLNEYPDIQQYSTAIDDIRRAMRDAIHQNRNSGGVNPSGPSGPSNSSGGKGPGGGPSGPSSNTPSGPSSSPTTGPLVKAIKPSNAQSIPLPLIVLGALAVLLFLAAAGTWFVRRLQARRMSAAPAPAHAPRPRS